MGLHSKTKIPNDQFFIFFSAQSVGTEMCGILCLPGKVVCLGFCREGNGN
jgi:hypothetical protein